MLDWDDLRFFLAIARHGSLTAAAKDLGVAQSTVGRRLASLEENLAVRLLNRTPEGYRLTLAGEAVRSQAERVEAEALAIERSMGGHDEKLQGTVRVSCTETLAVHASLPLLEAAEDVVLITVGGGRRNRGPTSEEMCEWLARHGVAARTKRVERGDEGPALVEAARAENADTLLAGAYTRGRLREMVLGGVTEYLVTKTSFPVLLMHA